MTELNSSVAESVMSGKCFKGFTQLISLELLVHLRKEVLMYSLLGRETKSQRGHEVDPKEQS